MARTKAHGGSYITTKGKKCRSVTTILGGNLGWNKQVLIGWARRQALSGHHPELVLKEERRKRGREEKRGRERIKKKEKRGRRRRKEKERENKEKKE